MAATADTGVESPVVLVVAVETKEVVEGREEEKNEVRRFTTPPSDEGVGREDDEGVALLKIEGRRLNMARDMREGENEAGGRGEKGKEGGERRERLGGKEGGPGKPDLALSLDRPLSRRLFSQLTVMSK